MSRKNRRPKWWQLYLVVPLLIVLFAMDGRLKISTGGHQMVQIGILIFIFGLVHFWLKANATALSNLDRERFKGTYTVIEIPPSREAESSHEQYLVLRPSNAEIKGVLDNTFEIDQPAAEAFKVEELQKKLNKE